MATKIDNLAQEIMEGLKEYADLASDDVKKAVRKAGNEVRKEISASAPADTGKYAKSWTVKKTKETSNVSIWRTKAKSGHCKWIGFKQKYFVFR